MAYRHRYSEGDLALISQKATELFGPEVSQAFQLGTQAAVTVNGLILVHNDDFDAFFVLRSYKLIAGCHVATMDASGMSVHSIGDVISST